MYWGHFVIALFLKSDFSLIEPCSATTAMAHAKKSIRKSAMPASPVVVDPTMPDTTSDAAAPIPIGIRKRPFMPKNCTLLSNER